MSMVMKSGTNEWQGAVENRCVNKNVVHRTALEQLARTNPFT
ncbi:MAG: hypothetical protein NTX13_03900 [Acidobacteria bacterium]|jgi:hypothetical protein|nr:hypothetical protein [Acidobacteriota bacterium]